MGVLTGKLPLVLNSRLTNPAKRGRVPNPVLAWDAIGAKVAEDTSVTGETPANLTKALGEGVGSIASGKRDLAHNKKHLRGYGR